jgi:hypothetical protein
MKPLVRVLALTAVLGFTALSTAHATVTACRYFCSGMIQQTTIDNCCGQIITCPNGQMVHPYGYLAPSGWKFCSPIG